MAETAPQWKLSVRPCRVRNERLIPEGELAELSLKQAIDRFDPLRTSAGRSNIINARSGTYIGVFSRGDHKGRNFLLVNQGPKGDIRWLLKKTPEFEHDAEIFRVEDVQIPKTAVDLPPLGMSEEQ